jgi:hypothetical protein
MGRWDEGTLVQGLGGREATGSSACLATTPAHPCTPPPTRTDPSFTPLDPARRSLRSLLPGHAPRLRARGQLRRQRGLAGLAAEQRGGATRQHGPRRQPHVSGPGAQRQRGESSRAPLEPPRAQQQQQPAAAPSAHASFPRRLCTRAAWRAASACPWAALTGPAPAALARNALTSTTAARTAPHALSPPGVHRPPLRPRPSAAGPSTPGRPCRPPRPAARPRARHCRSARAEWTRCCRDWCEGAARGQRLKAARSDTRARPFDKAACRIGGAIAAMLTLLSICPANPGGTCVAEPRPRSVPRVCAHGPSHACAPTVRPTCVRQWSVPRVCAHGPSHVCARRAFRSTWCAMWSWRGTSCRVLSPATTGGRDSRPTSRARAGTPCTSPHPLAPSPFSAMPYNLPVLLAPALRASSSQPCGRHPQRLGPRLQGARLPQQVSSGKAGWGKSEAK